MIVRSKDSEPSDWLLNRFETNGKRAKHFHDLCEMHPEIIQEMADQKCILEPEFIIVCQKYGIKFDQRFLDDLGFLF
jgi:hypothetical protein